RGRSPSASRTSPRASRTSLPVDESARNRSSARVGTGLILSRAGRDEPFDRTSRADRSLRRRAHERIRTRANALQVSRCRGGDPLPHELLAPLQHLRPALGILAARLEQAAQPPPPVLGVERLVRPVELHVELARAVAHRFESPGALALAADVLRLEVAEHAEAVERILLLPGLVDVAAERDLRRWKPPRLEPLLAHQHVAGLVVQPARRLARELPAELGRQLAEDASGRLDRPDLVQVADRRPQLEGDPLAVGVVRVEHVRPVEAGEEVAPVPSRVAVGQLELGEGLDLSLLVAERGRDESGRRAVRELVRRLQIRAIVVALAREQAGELGPVSDHDLLALLVEEACRVAQLEDALTQRVRGEGALPRRPAELRLRLE